jgi:hypothetical protein
MKHFVKELIVLFIVVPISLIGIFFVIQQAENYRGTETLQAKVEKKELLISSPVFGTVEQISGHEGDIVTRGQTLATINVLDKKPTASIAAEMYQYSEDEEKVVVKSPVDGVIARIELAEKSNVKPEGNVITIHPRKNTQIKIQSKKPLSTYTDMYLTDENGSVKYPITLTDRLPVSDTSGNVYYFATFSDEQDADDFYTHQEVFVKGTRPSGILTKKVNQIIQNASNLFATSLSNVL